MLLYTSVNSHLPSPFPFIPLKEGRGEEQESTAYYAVEVYARHLLNKSRPQITRKHSSILKLKGKPNERKDNIPLFRLYRLLIYNYSKIKLNEIHFLNQTK